MTDRRSSTPWLITAFVCGILAAWLLTPSRPPAPAPWSPVPSPHETRPILAGVMRLAKTLGWIMVFAQPAPPEVPETPAARLVDEQPEEPAEVGSDGYAVLRNQRGW